MTDLDPLLSDAQADFAGARAPAELEDAKARYLGKSGLLTAQLKALGALPPEEKKLRGAAINAAKQQVEAALQARRQALAEAELDAQLAAEAIDVTLPGRRHAAGNLHPVSRALERIVAIFGAMGFDVADGPEVETDWYSFTALNNPENHPARSMQDTFYVDLNDAEGRPLNLRPHTSPMQVRYARAQVAAHASRVAAHAGAGASHIAGGAGVSSVVGVAGVAPDAAASAMPDVRVIVPGRTYRVDSDATHSPMFHQVEGLWLGAQVSFRDLKAMYLAFARAFFETDALQLRFRPSYFPFTEPSAEIDIRFDTGALAGRWLEVAGCGQVHPNVVRHMGLDPEATIGFAFGSGIDRLAMLRYGVGDLRLFFEGDLRFLRQFA